MLLDALKFLADLGHKAAKPEVLEVTGQPDKKFVRLGNDIKEYAVPPPRRAHTVDRLEDVVLAAKEFAPAERGLCFVNQKGLVLYPVSAERLDHVKMNFSPSQGFLNVANLKKHGTYDQRDFAALLRRDLKGVAPDSLLPLIRKIDATSAARVSQEISQGRERGTREFQAEIIGASNLPDVVRLAVNVFQNTSGIDGGQAVLCTLDVTLPPAEIEFTLQPQNDELQNAIDRAVSEIVAYLRDNMPESVTVLFGSP